MRKFLLPAVAAFSMLAGAGITAAAESGVPFLAILNGLHKAQMEIAIAPPDKAGHRQRAMQYILKAITEVGDWRDEK